MTKRKKVILMIISISIVGLSLLILTYNKPENVIETNTGPIAIMLETEPGVYTKSQSNNWPTDDEYVYDSEKSYCVNGSDLIWNINKLTIKSSGPDKCYAYFKSVDSIPNEISERILEFNGGRSSIEGKGFPVFNNVAENNEGMYATYDDYGKSYYFRGAVDNNWVKFGNEDGKDIYWRIVRVNGDGSVKLIYTGTTKPQNKSESVTIVDDIDAYWDCWFYCGEEQAIPSDDPEFGNCMNVCSSPKTSIGYSAFNSSYNRGEYMGYMYELNKHRGHEKNSTIKTYLDTWYEDNLLDYEEYLSDFVVCNDRGFIIDDWTPIGPSYVEQFSDVWHRLRTTNTPQLICANKEDAYTTENTEVGNGKLTYPIGLLTADEATFAGVSGTTMSSSHYLYTDLNYWLVSPSYAAYNYAYCFVMYRIGYANHFGVHNAYGVRPVVSLSSDTKMVGSGKWNDPYRLPPPKFYQMIIANNGGTSYIESKNIPNFANIANTNEGMHAIEDDYGTSYYFRGAVDNNWVKFGKEGGSDIWWRIIRINGNGSIRMIYSGTAGPQSSNESVNMVRSTTQVKSTRYSTAKEPYELTGYMYDVGFFRKNTTSSVIKGELESWYGNTLLDLDDYIYDGLFCIDRRASTNQSDMYGSQVTPIGMPSSPNNWYSFSDIRMMDGNEPQDLKCFHKDDAFTKDDTTYGNAKLTQKVGLMAVEEAKTAGLVYPDSNIENYLRTGYLYWLLTPSFSGWFMTTSYNHTVAAAAGLLYTGIATPAGMRPVISLEPEIYATGSGHWNDPYIPILD